MNKNPKVTADKHLLIGGEYRAFGTARNRKQA